MERYFQRKLTKMFTFLSVWVRRLFRPKLTTVKVILFENGKEKSIKAFPDYIAVCILKSINEMFESRESSRYWFDTAIVEKGGFFQKEKQTEVLCTCYIENENALDKPRPINIPDHFRKRIFNKVHRIIPQLPNGKSYSHRLEIKFIIPK